MNRLVIVGLPRFASKLSAQLRAYKPGIPVRSYDTYYSTPGKLKAIPAIIRADVIYSINGSITESRVFNLAIKFRKKLIMHWVGTDVLKALEAYRSGNFNQHYIDYAEHWCEVDWIREELKEMKINAEIRNFVSFVQDRPLPEKPEQFSVLSYLHPDREEFYGIRELIACAEAFPDTPFNLFGTSGYAAHAVPENIKFHGWVNDLPDRIAQAGICVRYPEHDGLSSFVLESLSLGKQVAYRYPYPHCIPCYNKEDLIAAIGQVRTEFENGRWQANEAGAAFVHKEFSREKIFNELFSHLGIS